MAAKSSRDSSSSSYRCSAFLSFRGKDTRKGFTDHLYRALELAGIHTFRDDDEIKRGENIESELEKAIQESQVSIIVFSKDYASSRWCLNELLKIVERRNTDRRHLVLPVFYDVDPSDVRKQSGSFAEAFARHEERFSTEMDKVELWRRALGDVASLGGMVLGDRYEGQFIQDIVEEIRNKVGHAALDVAPFAVGMDNRVRRLNMWLQDGSNDVGLAVICGMGGIGKSTIAKAAYNQNFDRFEGSSFLADIRESSEQPNGFACLQRKLLSDIQKGNTKKVYNVAEGISRIKRAVGYKKVLIVLDDVNSRILDNLEFCTRIGIENLVDRCLVKIQGSKLAMHQLVRNMAMAIIREESPHDPGKRSRVLQNDASNILRKLSGTENIKGLMLNLASKRTFVGSDNKRCHVEDYDGNCSRRRGLGFFSWKPISFSSTNSASASNEIDFKSQAFRRMHNLEILILNNVNIRGSYEEFSKNLVCLSWRGFHLKSIPKNFCLENLVVLDMRNSSLQHVWNGTRVIPRLKILNFSYSHGLRTIPDFSGLYNLERLILKHCINLVEVHESIGHLEKLLVLNLKGCKNLMKLPILRSIQVLILSGCSKLELNKLNLVSAQSWYSVWSRVSPRKNTELSSFSLASLPHSLTSLSLDCCNISEIPSALTTLSSLEYLSLDENPITSLPESMNNLVKLQALKVSGCRNLTMLAELPHGLIQLNGRGCTSLKRITNLMTLALLRDDFLSDILLDLHLWYRGKLVDVESLMDTLALASDPSDLFDLQPKGGIEVQRNYCESFGRRRHIQGTYECGMYSIFIHGSKIPDRFNYRSMGNTVFSIIVPPHLNLKIVEWKVINEDALWLSHWIMGNNELECGEKVCFEIKEQYGFLAKEIGVQFVYEQQNKDKEDVPSSSEDTTIQRERSPWEWTRSFLDTTRPRVPVGVDTGVQCIHSCDKKVISTFICAAEFYLGDTLNGAVIG
ncbi:hypothetical protein FF1_025742 [Malus domestica]